MVKVANILLQIQTHQHQYLSFLGPIKGDNSLLFLYRDQLHTKVISLKQAGWPEENYAIPFLYPFFTVERNLCLQLNVPI